MRNKNNERRRPNPAESIASPVLLTKEESAGLHSDTGGNHSSGRTLVQVRDIAKAFRDNHVLRNISFSASEGEMVALLGANGSGKSTALRIVAGLHEPDQGDVEIDTSVGTAMIFQKIHLVARRSVLDNVCVGGLAHIPIWRSLTTWTFPQFLREEAMGCLERVGLADRAFDRCGSLSGGQQQRVAVARALCQRARVILADEPTSALDPTAAHQVMGLLRDISIEANIACIAVVHQPELALEYCDTIIGIKEGLVAFDLLRHACDLDTISTLYTVGSQKSRAMDAPIPFDKDAEVSARDELERNRTAFGQLEGRQ